MGADISEGRRPGRPVRRLIGLVALAVALAGCTASVSGAPEPNSRPSTTTPLTPSTTTPTTTTTPASSGPVSAACPLLSATEVGKIYDLSVAAQEGPPLVQSPATTYSCSYVNGANQKLAAFQVIVNPSAAGDPRHYLDDYVDEFLAAGASAQAINGLGAAADSYVKSSGGGPVAFVVATVQPVGSTLDLAQFIVSSSNAGDPSALKQMVGVLKLALSRL